MGGHMESRHKALYCLVAVDGDGRFDAGPHPMSAYHPSVRFLDQSFVTDCYLAGRWLPISMYDVYLGTWIRVPAPAFQPQAQLEILPDLNDPDRAGSETDDGDATAPLVESAPPTPTHDGLITTDRTNAHTVSAKRQRDGEDASDHPSSSRMRM